MLNQSRFQTLSMPSLLAAATLCVSTTAFAQPLEEAPFITSPNNGTLEMLSSAGVKRG